MFLKKKQKNKKNCSCRKTLIPAAGIGAASFPFDMEGANFATGALKVNPAYKKKSTYLFQCHSFKE